MSGAARHNNFDFIRIVAALMVLHGHGWELTGGAAGLWGVPFARVGLDIFFSVSGYLVTRSWDRTPDLGRFAARRAVRILPGLAACVLVTAFVLGPFVTRLPAGDYLADPTTWRYLGHIAFFNALYLPGVFEGMAGHGAVNGSLWSLLPEVACYVTVPILAVLLARLPRARVAALALLALLAGGVGLFLFEGWTGPQLVLYGVDVRYGLVEVPFFLVGAALALLERRVPGLWRADLCLLFFALNYGVSAWIDPWNLPLAWYTVPYMVIAFGRMSLPGVRDIGRVGDVSYGTYLYGFPVQQAVLWFLPGLAYPVLTCVAITLLLGFLSWHLVEKRALALAAARAGRAGPPLALGAAAP